ncbi:zinc finger, CCHC-type containing protein [Tanacetum coccineum]
MTRCATVEVSSFELSKDVMHLVADVVSKMKTMKLSKQFQLAYDVHMISTSMRVNLLSPSLIDFGDTFKWVIGIVSVDVDVTDLDYIEGESEDLALCSSINAKEIKLKYSSRTHKGNIITNSRVTPSWREIVSLNVSEVASYTVNLELVLRQLRVTQFSMESIGEEADVILGIKIKRKNKGIVITQSHYIEKILKKFNRDDCSPVSTPIDPIEKLKPNTGKPVDQLEYSIAIGCLMYATTSTRPDITYTISKLSRFTGNPSRQHWHAITRVFKYLKGIMNYGLSYVGYPSVLEAYSDASWINHVEDSSSMSG